MNTGICLGGSLHGQRRFRKSVSFKTGKLIQCDSTDFNIKDGMREEKYIWYAGTLWLEQDILLNEHYTEIIRKLSKLIE